MPRKRPTETSWDSDEDELLNETDTFSITSRSKEFDEELDEEALLGSDEETENDEVSIGESLSAKDTTKYGKPIATVTSMTNARRISPINWDQNANKSDDFEFEETADDIELYAPDDSTDFDVGTSQDYQPYTEEPAVEESINEEAEETETTFDQSHVTADTTRDESDESEDEEDTRRGRFKSERQDIVTSTTKTKTTKQAASADIPDNLEISDEQQAQINEFMATKDRKRRPNQRVRPFQQYRQMHPSRIQTITSTHMHHQPSPPPIMHPPPPVFAAPPQPRPKIHVNPAFYNRGMRPQSTTMTSVHNQPLMFDSPPRSQPPLFHHEPPRHFDERIPPLMDSYRHDRSSYNQGPPLPQHHHPPPHHQFGHPPASQPYPGPHRFQQPQDSRPLYGGPPPHVNSGNFGGSQPHPHEHPPYHRGPPGPNFPHDIPPRPDQFPGNHFDRHRHGSPGPRHFDQHGPMEPPRPNPFLQEQRFQPQPRMHQQPPTRMHQPNQPRMHQQVQPRMPHQPRNNIRPQRQPLMSSHRPLNGQQTPNNRFQGPRPSLQQQAGNKVLQKVKKEARMKKFGAIQNIPVIGRQTIKRPSSEEESSSPPKQLKSGIMTKVEDDYLKKIAAQKEMRAAIQRQKELKRQQTATIRRKELEEKLAKQGKDISELESADSESSDSASQISTTSVGRGQPLNRGQGQRGHPSNRGQVQSAQPSNQGQFARGNPGGRGQRGQQRGFPSNRGQGQQHQTIEGTSFQGNGRGRGVQRGRGNNTGRGGQLLRRGQTMEVHGSGPVTLLKSYTVTNVNEKGDIPETGDNFVDRRTAVEVIEDFRRQKQLKAQEESGASNRQVKVPTVKRMKKIIRTKRNAQGDILSQETVMVPLTPEEEAAAEAKFASQTIPTPVMLSPQKSPQRVVVASNREVVLGDQGGSTRTVIASSPPAGITSYQGGDSKRTVRIDNLSLSTSDNTIKSLCGCVGPFQGYQRAGKSAFIVFMDSKNASEFKNKYNRHMLDLSHISVELIPDLRPL